ncbi:DsrE family protein [bacterium]|nr:DsrE family protein [bacterium]
MKLERHADLQFPCKLNIYQVIQTELTIFFDMKNLMNQTNRSLLSLIAIFGIVVLTAGCNTPSASPAANSVQPDNSKSTAKIALISITSDPKVDPQAVNMGLTFAGFCLDEGYQVAIFFNVKGTTLPTTEFPDDFAYQDHAPMKTQLAKLKERGAELHVCPVCMNDLTISETQIIDEAFVTSKPKLFANLGSDTMVFTY